MEDFFRRVAHRASCVVGSAWAFSVAIAVVVVWAASGPLFHFSDIWQLVIKTATTVVTFLMVFVIQNSQNRDAKATLLKLDELIRAQTGARNGLINLEGLSEGELSNLEAEFKRLRESETGSSAQRANPKPIGARRPQPTEEESHHENRSGQRAAAPSA